MHRGVGRNSLRRVLRQAKRTWKQQDGQLEPVYDRKLARTLERIDLERPLPPLWTPFDALSPSIFTS